MHHDCWRVDMIRVKVDCLREAEVFLDIGEPDVASESECQHVASTQSPEGLRRVGGPDTQKDFQIKV